MALVPPTWIEINTERMRPPHSSRGKYLCLTHFCSLKPCSWLGPEIVAEAAEALLCQLAVAFTPVHSDRFGTEALKRFLSQPDHGHGELRVVNIYCRIEVAECSRSVLDIL